jgi:succinate--hydroxymethylglutarate CoA-transferase
MAGSTRGPSDGATKILDGITVLDLSTFVTGGFATLMLANQGAEVIKIERPDIGDDIRHSGPPFVEGTAPEGTGRTAAEYGESPYFWTVNYDKKSIELDLKTEAGREALYDLATETDVFVENYRPGITERLGIEYGDIHEYNEEIIYCSISAFGETGPWSERPGYDILVQGTSGIMSVTGPEDGEPAKVGLPATDLITAMWAAFGVVNALYDRERGGGGEYIELGMLDAAIPWLTKQAGKSFAGETPSRMGTKDPVIAPYQAYPTADSYLTVACGNQKLWRELCDAIDRPELADDPRFATNADRVEHMNDLEAELTATFHERTTAEWVAVLADEYDLPVGPVHDVDEALDNEQVTARNVISSIEHPTVGEIPVVEHPLNFANADSGFETPPPLLGEDTETLLHRAGYDTADIERLRENGAIPDR